MQTIEELQKYIKENNINTFPSKNPGVICIDGKHKSKIKKIDKVINGELECWESFYNNKWTTFLKNPKKSISNDYSNNTSNDYNNHEYDDHVELYEAFDYDEICCDPDLQEHWDDKYGAGNRDPWRDDY